MKKKLLSLLVSVVMVLSVISPMGAFAEVTLEDIEGETPLSLSEWSIANPGYQYNIGVTSAEAYNGSKSLHVRATTEDTTNTFMLKRNAVFVADHTYTISFYLKVTEGLENIALWRIDSTGKARNVNVPTFFTAESADDGWTKYTLNETYSKKGTTTGSSNLIFVLVGNADFYIDKISVTEMINDEPVELLPYSVREFETFVDPIPDLTERPLIVDADGNISENGNWTLTGPAYDDGLYNYIHVTSEEAYEGKNSAHIKFSGLGMQVSLKSADFQLKNSETYTLTAYIKLVSGDTNKMLSLRLGRNGSDVLPTGEATAKEGWLKYTHTLASGTSAGPKSLNLLFGNATADVYSEFDVYIDNVDIVDSQGVSAFAKRVNPTTLEVIGSIDGTFEDMVLNQPVTTPKLYCVDRKTTTPVTELTAEQSAKTLTAAATVLNNSDDDITAQLIVALYKDNILVDAALAPVTDVLTTDCGIKLRKEITLPEIAETDNYEMRVFVWDSITGMYPLIDNVTRF